MSAETRDSLDPAAVARLEPLELVARTLVEGFLKGHHFSAAKGASIEFAEHRPYAAGDDVRRVDWKAFGKTDRFYLKEYEDETNVRATMIVDASGSMAFGTAGITKARYAACLAAGIGYLLLAQRDAVGLAVAGAALRRYLPPKATARHLRGIFDALDAERAEGPTLLAACIHRVAERLRRRSLVVIVSDFLDDPREVVTAIAHLRHRHADVLAFHVLDPAEAEFPFKEWALFQDSEDPSARLRIDARQIRDVYLENLAEHLDVLRKGCAALEADYSVLTTRKPFDAALAAALDARSRRTK
ncbi:MAG: DUF58 domain-containing protein [Planctomycetes bacterium]|nr:DUF58 domain-containing protein [Planctomycetota bacterium]